MAICRLCNHDNPDGAQFCQNCGNNLQDTAKLSETAAASGDAVTSAPADTDPSASPVTSADAPQILPPAQAEVVSSTPAVIPVPAPAPMGGAQGAAPQTPPQPQPYVAVQGPNSQYYEPTNTVPFNAKDQAEYARRMANPNKPDYENVCVLALVFGILGFFFNPLYLISLAAIILGIIGHVNQGSKKTLGMIGWILGIVSFVTQLFLDIFCTFGLGIFC